MDQPPYLVLTKKKKNNWILF